MADEGADRSGVANSDVSPREDVGVDEVGGMTRRRERSPASSGGDPCTVEMSERFDRIVGKGHQPVGQVAAPFLH